MKFDSLHFALIAIVVLLAVYGFGSGGFRGGAILEGGKFNDKLDVFELPPLAQPPPPETPPVRYRRVTWDTAFSFAPAPGGAKDD